MILSVILKVKVANFEIIEIIRVSIKFVGHL